MPLLESVLKKYKNPIFVETGTARGEGIEAAKNVGFKKIISADLSEEIVKKVKKKFPDAKIFTGDTQYIMDDIVTAVDDRATFWLDAHEYQGVCGDSKSPLLYELEAISKHPIKGHNILIDDVRIFGTDYGFTISQIVEVLYEINPQYIIRLEPGMVPGDVIAASIKTAEVGNQD